MPVKSEPCERPFYKEQKKSGLAGKLCHRSRFNRRYVDCLQMSWLVYTQPHRKPVAGQVCPVCVQILLLI